MKNNACPTSPFSRLKRRGFLQLAAAAGVCSSPFSRLLAQTSSTGIKFNKLHCFEIKVTDVERSIDFYQGLLGMNIMSTFAGRTCLQVGDSNQFMAVRQVMQGEMPAITKLGYSVHDFILLLNTKRLFRQALQR